MSLIALMALIALIAFLRIFSFSLFRLCWDRISGVLGENFFDFCGMFGSGPLLSLGFVSLWSSAVFAVSLVAVSGLDAVVVVVMVVAEVVVVGASVVVGNVGGSARKKRIKEMYQIETTTRDSIFIESLTP